MIKNIPVFYKDNVPYRIDTDSLAIATISDLITVTASKYEDKIAVKYEDQQLTYKELEIRSNKLAYRLRKMGVGPGKLIGIYIERSLDMMVALLGTLKAGAAYIPLDPAYPADRISYMLEDSGSRLVLTKALW